jgi:hypothetical protein
MSSFELPYVLDNVPVKDALAKLRARSVGAVVTHLTGGHVIYSAAALTRAIRSQGNVPVGTIRGFETVAVPENAPSIIGAILDSTHVDFGVLESNNTTVRLVARSNERMRDLSTAVRICTCPSNPDHIYLESDLNGNHTCDLDGSPLNCD